MFILIIGLKDKLHLLTVFALNVKYEAADLNLVINNGLLEALIKMSPPHDPTPLKHVSNPTPKDLLPYAAQNLFQILTILTR